MASEESTNLGAKPGRRAHGNGSEDGPEDGSSLGLAPRPVPAAAPALAAAGVMAIGAAVGGAAPVACGGRAVGLEGAAWVIALAGLAVHRGSSGRLPPATTLLALALALGAAGRAVLHRPLHPPLGSPLRAPIRAPLDGPHHTTLPTIPGPRAVGRATPRRSQRATHVGALWTLHTSRGTDAVEIEAGTIRADESIAILGSAERPERARGPMSDAAPRALALEPFADEVVRISGPARLTTRAAEAPGRGHGLQRLRARGLDVALRHPDELTRGLLCALLFGDTSHLTPGVADLFTRTGTRHMLALSGLHVGLLGALIGIPLARAIAGAAQGVLAVFGSRRRVSPAVPLTALALLFVPLAGHGAPAARAALALALAAIGPRLRLGPIPGGRRPNGLNLLGVALIVEIGLDPLAPLRPGVQLSYLATAALMVVAPVAARRFLVLAPGGPALARTWRSGRARSPLGWIVALRLKQALLLGTSTSLVASAATLPVVWTRFGEWSPVGVVATPLAMPALVVLVIGGWIWIVFPAMIGDAALTWASEALVALLAYADRVPWSPLPLPERPLIGIAAACCFALAGMGARESQAARRRLRLAAALGGGLLLPWPIEQSGLAGVRVSPRARSFEVHVLDVGAGTAVVARAPDSPTWIFDAGSRDRIGVAQTAVAPLLRAMDVGRLHVVLSHDHADHSRALPWIARRWPPALWVGPTPSMTEPAGLAAGPIQGVHHRPLGVGSSIVSRAGATLEVRAIRAGHFDDNEGSAVLDLRWATGGSSEAPARVVLSGDAEGEGLAQLLSGDAQGPWLDPGPIDALLLPHHGSDCDVLGPLLDHLRPREVWVSSSQAPSPLAELERRGLRVRCTASDGFFQWSSDGPEVP